MSRYLNDAEKLRKSYHELDESRRQSLLEFAEFRSGRSPAVLTSDEIGDPVDMQRSAEESVIGAIKRLKLTYPMIDSMSVFSTASDLMTEHMVQGRDVLDVIAEMENDFEKAYLEMKEA